MCSDFVKCCALDHRHTGVLSAVAGWKDARSAIAPASYIDYRTPPHTHIKGSRKDET